MARLTRFALLALALSAAAPTASGAAQEQRLYEEARYSPFSVGLEPSDLKLDEQGYNRLLVTERGSDRLSLYAERNGRLVRRRSYRTPAAPSSFLLTEHTIGADYTGVVHPSLNRMRLLRGDLAGLTPFASVQTGRHPVAAVVASLTFDGPDDLVVANRASDDLSVFERRDGRIQRIHTVPVGDRPSAITANSNTALVVWVANAGSDSVTALFGLQDDGALASRKTIPVGDHPSDVVEINMSRNGYAYHLAVANRGSDTVSLVRMRETSNDVIYEPAGTYRVGNAPVDLAVIDADHRHGPDLAVVNSRSDDLSFLLNDGNGGFDRGPTYRVGPKPAAVEPLHFNRYFGPDLAVANSGGASLTVLLKHESGVCRGRPARLYRGTNAKDEISASPGPDVVALLDGNDASDTFAAPDCIFGGEGSDYINGGGEGDRLFGGPGRDDVYAGGGGDVLHGGPARDNLRGDESRLRGVEVLKPGADRLFGGGGDDNLVPGPDSDVVSGGAGDDLIDARDRYRDRVDCGPGTDRVSHDRRDVVRNCERVAG